MADGDHTLDEIRRLRRRAEDLLRALNAESFPDDPEADELRERVAQYARDQIRMAKDPVAIGVVGEFSVGKSLMLGTLFGRPALLPTDQRPTTGNVTALYLLPGKPGEPTRFDGQGKVHYLTAQELSGCVRYMLDQLIAATKDLIDPEQVAELEEYDPLQRGWNLLEKWCRQHVWQERFGNLELRKIAVELLALRDAHLSGAAVLGRTVLVTEQHVRAALRLGKSDEVPDTFPERDVVDLTEHDVENSADALRRTFPLIRRIDFRVLVDPQVWSLDGLRDQNEVVLLDFPGLTANRSAKRDEFLSRTELRDIHTIITVIDAGKPQTEVPHKFYTMLQRKGRDGQDEGRDSQELRNSILAVGNRFDLITPPSVPEGEPVTVARLREASQNFDGFCTNAVDLVQRQSDRIRMVSSPVGMVRRGYPPDEFTDEEAKKIKAALEEAGPCADAWQALADRLKVTEPDDPWTENILAFAADGGFGSLRELIEQHVRAHGLSNKLRAMQRLDRVMEKEVFRLERRLAPIDLKAGEDVVARETVGALFDEFRQQTRRLREAVQDFRDPLAIRCADGEPLLDRVRNVAVTDVMRWAEWQTILQQAEGGFIPKREPRGKGLLSSRVGGPLKRGEQTTRTFLKPFTDSFAEALRVGRKELATVYKAWLAERTRELAELRERFEDPEMQRLLDAGLSRLQRQEESDLLEAWRLTVDLTWLEEACPQPDEVSKEEMAAQFPLFVDRAMPWHPKVRGPEEEIQERLSRHQFYVFRLQRELAKGVVDAVTQALTAEIREISSVLLGTFEEMRDFIPDPAHIRTMFPPEDGGGAAEGEPPAPDASPLRDLLREWRA